MTTNNSHSPLYRKLVLPETRYSLFIYIFFLLTFFIFTHNKDMIFSPAVSVYYVLSYKFGFIPRAFIGSLLGLFTDYLTLDLLRIVISAITLILLGMVSILLGKAISKSELDYKPSVKLLTLLILTAPLSHTYLIERHFGRLDIFLFFFTLVALICLKKPYIRWAVPFLCFAAVATHPGYMVTFMPALAIPMLYEVYRNNYSKKSILLFSSCCLILVSFFVYFQFLSPPVDFANAEAFGKYLSEHTDMKISNPVLYLEYFSQHLDPLTNPNPFTELEIPIAKSIALPIMLVFLAFTLPLLTIFVAVWKESFRKADNKFLKLIFVFCSLSPLAFIPAALFAHDWDRWWAAVIICQFILFFYFILAKEKPFNDSLKMLNEYFDEHAFVIICILIFSSSLTLSNINSFALNVLDKDLWLDFFTKVLPNFDNML